MDKSLYKPSTKIFGQNIFLFETIDSTNKKALSDMETEFIPNGTCYIAVRQTNGMGSYGRTYDSDTNLGLWLSIVVHEPYLQNPVTFVPAVAAAVCLKDYGVETHVKWPNDVLIKDKKIAGILCLAKTMPGGVNACVVGIGININQSQDDFAIDIRDNAVSLRMSTGNEYKIHEVFKKYIKYFEEIYYGNIPIVELWKEHSLMIGKTISGKMQGKSFNAKVIDITKEGHLVIESGNGREELLSHGALDIDRDYYNS